MNADEFKGLDLADLKAKVKALEEDVFRVRFQHATAQLQDSTKLSKSRRELARAKTILHQKESGK